jgi:uncharacterized membrane-anchored protein
MTSYGRKALLLFILTTLVCCVAAVAQEPAQQPQGPRIDWQRGPAVGHLGDIAEINVPQGYQFAAKQGAETILQLTHNIPNGKELGVLVSSDPNSNWFMIFRFDDTGYIKDDEKDSLDANAILQNIKDGTEAANEKRKQHGWPPFHVIGWERTPYYDPQTHNLTWAIQGKGDDPNEPNTVNHSIRLLGRRGTINVNLVASPQEYAASRADFNILMSGFNYNQGHRYADFVKGDKVAEYGLAALIAGGAGAVLIKSGLLAKFGKFIIAGIVAIGAALKKFFSSIFGSKETKIEDPNKQAAAQG